jgi:uncharacterized repeat protein (TIGR03917 family)
MEDTAIDAGLLAQEPGRLAELPRSLAEVVTVREDDAVAHELSLSPGATAADVTAAMILMPPAAALLGQARVLIFREPARSGAGAAASTGGAADDATA